MKKISLLGSTGSIGQNTLRIVAHAPEDFQVVALAAHRSLDVLSEQIRRFRPELVAVYERERAETLRSLFPDQRIVSGEEGLEEVASHPDADIVVMAIVGMRALRPTLAAIQAGKSVALASKEVLVAAGKLVEAARSQQGVSLIPIDSEHSALFQCLEGRKREEVGRLILTASGGPFRLYTQEACEAITYKEALAHPVWSMGPKVTIDSSTLMNKGLEMIEAYWLFQLPEEKIEVVVHPQSVIHSLVEWVDGSLFAQMSEPHMIYPIQYALTYPARKKGLFPPFDLLRERKLEFFPPDLVKFPALSLAREALRRGGSASCYLNAANEVLVERFLKQEISWVEIIKKLAWLFDRHRLVSQETLEEVYAIDQEARREALLA